MNIADLLNKKNSFAIIGASENPDKYGYKIVKQLLDLGYKVYPINPKSQTILNQKVFSNLNDISPRADVLNFVVPPVVSLAETIKAYDLGYRTFWYQPGSYDESVLSFHTDKDTNVISDQCILIKTKEINS